MIPTNQGRIKRERTSSRDEEQLVDGFRARLDDITDEQHIFIEKLTNIEHKIMWDIPKLHQISYQSVRLPKTVQEIKQQGVEIKTGHFNRDEDRIIENNWDEFCSTYALPNNPKIFAHWRNKNHCRKLARARRFVILWLARDLPYRTPAQVYQRFIHTLGSRVKGRFSESELAMIEAFLSFKKREYTQQYLATLLGRDERSIWRCINLLKKRGYTEEKTILKWTLELCEKLVRAILQELEGQQTQLTHKNLLKLKDRRIVWQQWVKIGERISLPPLKIKVHWYSKLYAQLFSPHPIYVKDIFIKILVIIKRKGYKTWQDIQWSKVAENFDNLPPLFLSKRFYYATVKRCKCMKNLSEAIEYLYDLYVTKDIYFKNSKLLRLQVTRDNNLEIVY